MQDIGSIKFRSDDLDKEVTVKEYLKELLLKLWIEGENFNGKRPWGNSSWDWNVYKALIEKGVIEGRLDEDGYIEKLNEDEANKVIVNYIKEIFG